MKYFKSVLFLIIASITGCATIPSESVKLSAELGDGILKQHRAEIKLLNIYFESKRKELDNSLQKSLNAYLTALIPKEEITLTAEQLVDISRVVLAINEKANTAKENLEKVRVELISQIEENYLTLSKANSTITSLLQSAVSVKESADKSIQLISTTSDGKIQIDKIFSEIDSYVKKGGYESEKIIELSEKIGNIIK